MRKKKHQRSRNARQKMLTNIFACFIGSTGEKWVLKSGAHPNGDASARKIFLKEFFSACQIQILEGISFGANTCSFSGIRTHTSTGLVAPYHAILRYYRCDAPYRAILFQEDYRYPLLVLSFAQAHLCDTPFCYISRTSCAIPIKSSTKEFRDPIATSIARYEKYRCWASKNTGINSWQIIHVLVSCQGVSKEEKNAPRVLRVGPKSSSFT